MHYWALMPTIALWWRRPPRAFSIENACGSYLDRSCASMRVAPQAKPTTSGPGAEGGTRRGRASCNPLAALDSATRRRVRRVLCDHKCRAQRPRAGILAQSL